MVLKLPYEQKGTIPGYKIEDIEKLRLEEEKERLKKEKEKVKDKSIVPQNIDLKNIIDETTKTNDKETDNKEIPKDLPSTPEITFNDNNTATVVMPDGRTFVGISKEEARGLVENWQQKQLPEEIQPAGTAQRQLEQQTALQTEQQRLIEEEVPTLRQLNPTKTAAENIPIIGSVLKGIQPILEGVFVEGSTLSAKDVLEFATSEIQRKEIEKGLTWSERLGALAEGVPGAGKAFAILDIETPRGNLEEVMKDIKTQKKRISTIESNVKIGYLPVEVAREQIKDIEQYILRQEARLKLLINNSPSLNFNSDRINGFETDILSIKERIFQAKLNILTGAEKNPTALDIYLRQQAQEQDDWATSEF